MDKTGNYQTKLDSKMLSLKYGYRSFTVILIYVFCFIFILLLTLTCIRTRMFQINKNNDRCNIFDSLSGCFKSCNDSIQTTATHLSSYLTSLCPNIANRLRKSTKSFESPSGNIADDDRLNLAEYQVFDDGVNEESGRKYIFRASLSDQISDCEDMQNNKNPYRNLSFKI